MFTTPAVRFLIVAGTIMFVADVCRADVPNVPIHPHDPSPVMTFGTPPLHEHQHRTAHDPNGVGSVHKYVATKSWISGVQHLSIGNGGTHAEFAHGHMDEPTFYHFHNPPLGPETIPVAAQQAIMAAFNTWNAVSAVEINWPNSVESVGFDDDTVPGTGILIHSTINFQPGADFPVDHVHAEWSNAGLTLPDADHPRFRPTGALAAYFPSIQTLRFSPNPGGIIDGWYYGPDVAGMGSGLFDFPTIALHETGHVVAFGHWGTFVAGNIMQDGGFDVRGNPQSVLRSLGHAEHHAARDIYSIPVPAHAVPEPSTFMLLSIGILGLLGWGWRRKRAGSRMAAV